MKGPPFPILLSSLLMTPSLLSTLYLLSEGHPLMILIKSLIPISDSTLLISCTFVYCKAGSSNQLTKKALCNWSIQCDCPLLDSWLKFKQLRQIPSPLPLQSNDHSLWGPSYCSKSQLSSLLFCIYLRVSSALCRVCLVHFWKLPQKEYKDQFPAASVE